jgi:isoprenylcysteine carboxyl methyltransferase (ICMT) family protein YpbQ
MEFSRLIFLTIYFYNSFDSVLKFIRHSAYAVNIMQASGISLILKFYLFLSLSVMLIIFFLYRLKLEDDVLIGN